MTARNDAQTDRLLRLAQVQEITGLKRSTLYDLIQQPEAEGGGFPPPVKIGRISAWPESEVRSWIEARKAARFSP